MSYSVTNVQFLDAHKNAIENPCKKHLPEISDRLREISSICLQDPSTEGQLRSLNKNQLEWQLENNHENELTVQVRSGQRDWTVLSLDGANMQTSRRLLAEIQEIYRQCLEHQHQHQHSSRSSSFSHHSHNASWHIGEQQEGSSSYQNGPQHVRSQPFTHRAANNLRNGYDTARTSDHLQSELSDSLSATGTEEVERAPSPIVQGQSGAFLAVDGGSMSVVRLPPLQAEGTDHDRSRTYEFHGSSNGHQEAQPTALSSSLSQSLAIDEESTVLPLVVAQDPQENQVASLKAKAILPQLVEAPQLIEHPHESTLTPAHVTWRTRLKLKDSFLMLQPTAMTTTFTPIQLREEQEDLSSDLPPPKLAEVARLGNLTTKEIIKLRQELAVARTEMQRQQGAMRQLQDVHATTKKVLLDQLRSAQEATIQSANALAQREQLSQGVAYLKLAPPSALISATEALASPLNEPVRSAPLIAKVVAPQEAEVARFGDLNPFTNMQRLDLTIQRNLIKELKEKLAKALEEQVRMNQLVAEHVTARQQLSQQLNSSAEEHAEAVDLAAELERENIERPGIMTRLDHIVESQKRWQARLSIEAALKEQKNQMEDYIEELLTRVTELGDEVALLKECGAGYIPRRIALIQETQSDILEIHQEILALQSKIQDTQKAYTRQLAPARFASP